MKTATAPSHVVLTARLLASLACVAALPACATVERPPEAGPKDIDAVAHTRHPDVAVVAVAPPGEVEPPPPTVTTPAIPTLPAGLPLEGYQLTPSDCETLGRRYGENAKSDQMAQLSPNLSDARRAGVSEQLDRVIGKLASDWTATCQRTFVDKTVDHAAVECALKSTSVRDFDVCLINGPNAGALDKR